MLQNLHVKNIVLIDEIELEFGEGFTSLTGETGAGKSILLTALGLLLGNKGDKSVIRFGQDAAEVTGEFFISERTKEILLENELGADELLIRRRITSDGKSKAYVNDTPISLKLLTELGATLVEIHSQHEQSTLFDSAVQREIVDKFAKINLRKLEDSFVVWNEAAKELETRKEKIAQAKKDEDYLRHVLEELTGLNPQEGEENELSELRTNMKNFEQFAGTIREAEEDLTRDKNIETALMNAQKTLMRAKNDLFSKAIESVERASIEVAEIFSELQDLQNKMDADPARLNEIEERLFAIRGMARKYDCHPDQLADFMKEVSEKLSLLGDEEKGIKSLESKVEGLKAEYLEIAKDISSKRKGAAKKLEGRILEELKPLAMQATKFEVKFEEQKPSANGIDRIEFLASTNPGTPLSTLSKIASGGEISRFMLALKVVLLGASAAPTVIFDEIDTGTGGSVAAAIGERLARLGSQLQVFVVTHLPQVAAQAKSHFLITKQEEKGSNLTRVKVLSSDERKEELARMLSGSELTEEARAQALKLMA